MEATGKLSSIARRMLRWAGLTAAAALVSGSALAGIANTKHNLSSTGPGNRFSGTDQICVFCHTPHGSDTAAPVPLWNRQLPTQSFSTYDALGTQSLDGAVLAVGSVSLACLSCHDGTQAMNNVINAPGVGLNNVAWATGSWSAGGAIRGGGISGGALTGVVAVGASNDLKDDHPIGIQYCGGGLTVSTPSSITGTCKDADFVGATAVTVPKDGGGTVSASIKGSTINSKNTYWIEVDGNSGRGKGDIQLYTRDFSGTNYPSVECGSCHDPHVEPKGTNNVAFMRVTAAGSTICLSCHIK